jgi:LuxR family maltose regulon positive regulatory protein
VHAEAARTILGGVASNRSWLGANASVALGVILEGEGSLADAERELTATERHFRDEVATVHHAWSLLLLARVRCRRGRLDDAESALRAAREAIGEFSDGGRVASLAAEIGAALHDARQRAGQGELLERPSDAELSVLRLLAGDLSTSAIGRELYLSPNTIRSHTRSLYRKLGVNSRADAVARAGSLGLLG